MVYRGDNQGVIHPCTLDRKKIDSFCSCGKIVVMVVFITAAITKLSVLPSDLQMHAKDLMEGILLFLLCVDNLFNLLNIHYLRNADNFPFL